MTEVSRSELLHMLLHLVSIAFGSCPEPDILAHVEPHVSSNYHIYASIYHYPPESYLIELYSSAIVAVGVFEIPNREMRMGRKPA